VPAVSFVDEMELLVQWYPADRHLPDIAAILAGAHLEFTRPLVEAYGADPAAAATPEIRSMRYRPGESGTLKISVPGVPAVFVKVYRHFDADAVQRPWSTLGEAATASGGAFAVPPVAGVVAERRALAILPAPGRALDHLLAEGAYPADLARRAVDAILAFQRSGAVLERQWNVEDSMQGFRRAAGFVCWGEPSFAPRIERLGAEIERRFRQTVLRPAHLDLKPDHLFVDEAGLATFIDVDSAGMADPMLDPAHLVARLDLAPVPDAASGAPAAAFRQAFLTRMRAEYPADLRANFAPAYALGAIKVALFQFQHLRPGWRASIDTILNRIETELADPVL